MERGADLGYDFWSESGREILDGMRRELNDTLQHFDFYAEDLSKQWPCLGMSRGDGYLLRKRVRAKELSLLTEPPAIEGLHFSEDNSFFVGAFSFDAINVQNRHCAITKAKRHIPYGLEKIERELIYHEDEWEHLEHRLFEIGAYECDDEYSECVTDGMFWSLRILLSDARYFETHGYHARPECYDELVEELKRIGFIGLPD